MKEAYQNNNFSQVNSQLLFTAKKSSSKQPTAQLSQRSVQPAGPSHQKTNSVTGGKMQQQQNQQILNVYEEQNLPQNIGYVINTQNLNQNNINALQTNQKVQQTSSANKQTHQINSGIGGAVHHKKSNSLMNSKMAQLLLKGVNGTQKIQNCQIQTVQPMQINKNNVITSIGVNGGGFHQGQFSKQIQGGGYININQNSSNLTSSLGSQVPISNQTSFIQNPLDLVSYSIDYQKPFYQAEDGRNDDQCKEIYSYSQLEQNNIQQVPSIKQLTSNQKQFVNTEQFIQVKQEPKKKQSQLKMSSQKGQTKKSPGNHAAAHHQRTKSDNIYNRGSLMGGPNQNIIVTLQEPQKNIGSSQQQKRIYGNQVMKNNFIDFQQMETNLQKSGHMKHASIGSEIIATSESNTRKAQSSVQSQKKQPNIQLIARNQIQQISQPKKSTKEKYLELKVAYNDLLEKHQQFVASQHVNVQQQSNQNLFNFYPNQQFPSKGDTQATPRIIVQAQPSVGNLVGKQEEYHVSKTLKHTTNKLDAEPQILSSSKAVPQKSQLKVQLQTAQGVSRKSGGNHKRSVSDGNEQMFKFKQNPMHRYLYPQPSNQTINGPSNNYKYSAQDGQPMKQEPNHQRRVSDDYQQKMKKQAMAANKHNFLVENVPLEPFENHKPPNVDFNIKGFLIEMRNKQGNIQVIEQYSPRSNQEHQNQQFAMIIEENSPQQHEQLASTQQPMTMTLESSRKLQVAESLHARKGSNVVQPSKPAAEFNKIIQKYKKLVLEDNSPTMAFEGYEGHQIIQQKRAPSPSLESQQNQEEQKLIKASTHHKRVKSDIPDTMQHKNYLNRDTISKRVSKKASLQSSNSNIMLQSDKNTPKKIKNFEFKIGQSLNPTNKVLNKKPESMTKKVQIKDPSNNILIQNNHEDPLECSSNKKIVNVSIDLIKEGEIYIQENDDKEELSRHYEGGKWIVVDKSIQNLNLQNIVKDKQKNQYQDQHELSMKAFSGGSNEVMRQQKYQKMKQKYLPGSNQSEDEEIVKKGKQNIQISQSSPVLKKKEVFKFQKPNILEEKKKQQKNSGRVETLNGSLSPKQDKQIKSKINSTPVQQNKKQQNNSLNQGVNPKKNNGAPANSIVQTQESARNSQVAQFIIKSDIRIETQESTASDPNLSPRQKMIIKLTKHIKLSFKQTGAPPNTTVDFYRIGKVLGKGAFGKVNLALHKLTQKFAAVKSINKQYLSEDSQTKKVMQEVVILKRTRHRNIVRLYEFFETQKHILFVIELCAGGDLLNYVRKRRRLKEDVAKFIFRQLIEGLGYCHSKQILHRDIKLDNILLDSEGEVKICDFGVSKLVKKGEKMTEQCGTPAYIAPEILRDKGYEGFAVDVWSAGVVLYAMLYGTVPFKANNMSELQKLIMKAKYTLKEDLSEEAQQLIKGCLEKDPAKRMTINQILQHRWLQDVDETIQLFTQQEKDYINNEFTYNDADRYNRNETDPFTEHMLDSTQNSMLKNCTSKSVILAPFNSTKSNLEECTSMSQSMKEMLQSKGCIKFAARVRDIDKQYEVNNNAELDNGVYHKATEEDNEENKEEEKRKLNLNTSEDSLQSSFNKESSMKSDDGLEEKRINDQERKLEKKKKKKNQTEFEKLEKMIHQEEQDKEDENEGDYVDLDNNPYGSNYKELAVPVNEKIVQSAYYKEESKGLNNVLQSAQTLIIGKQFELNDIDQEIVQSVEQYGYPKEYLIKSLNCNEINYATTSYFLMLNSHTMTINQKKDFDFASFKELSHKFM